MTTTPPNDEVPPGGEPVTPTPYVSPTGAVTPAAAVSTTPPAPPAPKRSVLTTVLLLLVTLLLGIVIGLLIDRAVLNAEPAPDATPVPTSEATESPGASGETTDAEEGPYPELPDAELVAIMEAQIRRDPNDPTAIGSVDAPVVIAEWADYRCGYCQKFGLETLPAIQHYIDDGLVRVEWNDFPVFQEESLDLAVAAQAAGEQGLFREMGHAIMAYQAVDGGTDFSRENILALASSIGVPDMAAFEASLDSEEILAAVNASYENALTVFGRAATPQFIVNYQYIGGFLDGDGFSAVIDQELLRIADNS